MNNSTRVLLIFIAIWVIVLIGAVGYELVNAPMTCYNTLDVENEAKVVSEPLPNGMGCQPNYGLAMSHLLFPFIIWVLVLVIALLIWKLKQK